MVSTCMPRGVVGAVGRRGEHRDLAPPLAHLVDGLQDERILRRGPRESLRLVCATCTGAQSRGMRGMDGRRVGHFEAHALQVESLRMALKCVSTHDTDGTEDVARRSL